MEAICGQGDIGCEVDTLTAALHGLHLYCGVLAATIICCCRRCGSGIRSQNDVTWRWQNLRGIASLGVGVVWSFSAASAALRSSNRIALVAASLAPAAWFTAVYLHTALWNRRTASPILYLFFYWLLAAATSSATLVHQLTSEVSVKEINIYLHSLSLIFCLTLAFIDGICFYDEIVDRTGNVKESLSNITYQHMNAHFFSKITFFWLNPLLYKGFGSSLEQEDLGKLPDNESSMKHYRKFKKIYELVQTSRRKNEKGFSMLQCYIKMVWPNFYISGILKLLGDLMGLVPPLGLSVVVQHIVNPVEEKETNSPITIHEFLNNGFIMVLIITISSIGQAILSQNSTHLVSVEGIRLKTALQAMIYDKCMLLAPWAATHTASDESEPLLNTQDNSKQIAYSGLLTNLVSQDTYNIMSCVWVCHYVWAIPIKVGAILYLLYIKLGVSAIIGCAASILFVTPLQFYIGKKISDNSKAISKTSDHRITKMTEILQGITVIKLYVWENLFKEKILNLREVELKLLNKDSIYWGILTFTTQASTILVTVITFMVYYLIGDGRELSAGNVFAGLALFSQLSIPLLVLPVTVLMVVQATISTKRIKDFLELPDSHNVADSFEGSLFKSMNDKFNDAFIETKPADTLCNGHNKGNSSNITEYTNDDYHDGNPVRKNNNRILIKMKNAVYTWGERADNSPLIEIDDLELESGKLIMVVGPSGSGKSSLLSAILGEMCIQRGEASWDSLCSMWYAGQPPWLLESSVRDNILMGSPLCQRTYAKVLRCTGLKPDLQLLPEGDRTILGSRGTPLSGGQRVRVCVARALYSRAQLLVFDEPLASLDTNLAKLIAARGLTPAARSGRTVLLATNRLELLHYADKVIVMEDCRVVSYGKPGDDVALRHWGRLAEEARIAAAKGGAGPAGGVDRERTQLVRTLSRAHKRHLLADSSIGMSEATGAHLLAELPTRSGGTWRRASRTVSALTRQLSSPPPMHHRSRCRHDIRRVVSADYSNNSLRREASLFRRLLNQSRQRTISRWTPRPLRRLLSPNSNGENLNLNVSAPASNVDNIEDIVNSTAVESEDTTLHDDDTIETKSEEEDDQADTYDSNVWWEYGKSCGWWCVVYWSAAAAAQSLVVVADWWLAKWTAENLQKGDEMWSRVWTYATLCASSAICAGGAQAAMVCAGASARRTLHERLLQVALNAAPHTHEGSPVGSTLHIFSSDIHVIDKKLPMTVTRWAQLLLVCGAAVIVNVLVTPWSLLVAVPALVMHIILQTVYRRNARELARLEAATAAPVSALASEVRAGAPTIRAGRLQMQLRMQYAAILDNNHAAAILLNATNRWLGLALDLVGAGSVCGWLLAALAGGQGSLAGLAGAYSLLLPAYLAHLARSRADLDLHLTAAQRVLKYTRTPQEDYRDHCSAPESWPANGEINFERVSVQHTPGGPDILTDISLKVKPGEKLAICGRSGSGKSTLLMSCVGAATITAGQLSVCGVPTDRLSLRSLRHRLVVLPQEVALFSGTLRENLDPLAVHTDHEIWQSLRVVGLYEFVAAQPAGLECTVNGSCDRGGWCGGRAARVCAARAALLAPTASALLLDEPAAALDVAAERNLLTAFANAAPSATILTVAHRASSVRDYDRVAVVERGRIIELDTPTALLITPTSRFARMLAAASREPHKSVV